MTDTFRDLCAELAETLAEHQHQLEGWYHPDHPDATRLDAASRLLDRARAALAEGDGVGVTDEELLALAAKCLGYSSISYGDQHLDADGPDLLDFARAVLERWGTTHPRPIPVGERPWEREGFCDAKGRCWCGFTREEIRVAETGDDEVDFQPEESLWRLMVPPLSRLRRPFTHCLPAAAIPLPAQEGADG
jgi:hypothetical protein